MPDLDDYVDVRELHPACVLLPCRYDHCDAERWVCGPGSTKDYSICRDCAPDVDLGTPAARVRL